MSAVYVKTKQAIKTMFPGARNAVLRGMLSRRLMGFQNGSIVCPPTCLFSIMGGTDCGASSLNNLQSLFDNEYRLVSPSGIFKPYQGDDVKQGPGQYVKLSSGVWANCTHQQSGDDDDDCFFDQHVVTLLGWGNTYGGLLEDYSYEDQVLLITTLPKPNAAKQLGHLGTKGGAAITEAMQKSSVENRKKGGRPKKLTLSNIMTREIADQLLDSYCYDTPPDGAYKRLLASPALLVSESSTLNHWVRIYENLGLPQDILDSILYPNKKLIGRLKKMFCVRCYVRSTDKHSPECRKDKTGHKWRGVIVVEGTPVSANHQT